MKNRNIKIFVVTIFCSMATMVLSFCAVTPIFLVQNGPSAMVEAGTTVQYQVGISRVAPTGGQVLVITPDDSDNFSSIPSTVTVPAGHTSATFQATISPAAAGVVSLEAGCNGTSTDCPVLVVDNQYQLPPRSEK